MSSERISSGKRPYVYGSDVEVRLLASQLTWTRIGVPSLLSRPDGILQEHGIGVSSQLGPDSPTSEWCVNRSQSVSCIILARSNCLGPDHPSSRLIVHETRILS